MGDLGGIRGIPFPYPFLWQDTESDYDNYWNSSNDKQVSNKSNRKSKSIEENELEGCIMRGQRFRDEE